jgi:hypothetical protein
LPGDEAAGGKTPAAAEIETLSSKAKSIVHAIDDVAFLPFRALNTVFRSNGKIVVCNLSRSNLYPAMNCVKTEVIQYDTRLI